MDNSTLGFLLVAGVLVLALFGMSFVGARTKKYRVVSSQPDLNTGGLKDEVLIRKWNDKFNDPKDMKCFHGEDGRIVLLGNHWIIRMEEVKEPK